jgi:hypothetical protein
VVSAELPPRPDEQPTEAPKRRAVTLATPPGPTHYAAALAEACAVFDAVAAREWRWPDPEAMPATDDAQRLAPANLQRLMDQLQRAVVGEKVERTDLAADVCPMAAQADREGRRTELGQ